MRVDLGGRQIQAFLTLPQPADTCAGSLFMRQTIKHLEILNHSFVFSWYYGIMIQREALLETIQTAIKRSRVVALTGPRQSGKTTLARQFVPPDSINYFDLEDLTSLARLEEPMTALR
jgi:ABC-type multidrug transport system fused ATPase/permease subunit